MGNYKLQKIPHKHNNHKFLEKLTMTTTTQKMEIENSIANLFGDVAATEEKFLQETPEMTIANLFSSMATTITVPEELLIRDTGKRLSDLVDTAMSFKMVITPASSECQSPTPRSRIPAFVWELESDDSSLDYDFTRRSSFIHSTVSL